MKTRKGFALILTLSVIVLLTGLLLSLLSLTTNKRTQTKSATEMMRVNALARGAADQVASTFLTEIKERSDIHLQESSGTSPRTIYKPRGDSMIPGRVVHPKLAATWRTGTAEWSNPNFVNLIRQSLPSSQLGGNTPPELKRLSNASIIRTSDTLDPSTWNKVQLTNGEFEVDTAPNWIYLDRLGNTQVGTNPAFSDKKKDEYIVGRYAFNVYNVGGLLDINSSGVTPSLTDTVLPKKGSPLSLDITQIPGFDSASESELTKFFEWRDNTLDPETLYDVAGVNGASNDGYVTAGGKKGWLSAIANPEQTSNSNRFISRSDLIASLKELLGPENAAKALPHLSTENRFVDRPNHIPDPGLPQPRFGMNEGGSDAQFFPTANDGTWALVDGKIKPLMKQRFPLDRIALFENPSENEDKIREYFGLEEDEGYWKYIDENSAFSDAIYTLDQVAELDREPNFFEILKAAIHSGSLGIQHDSYSQYLRGELLEQSGVIDRGIFPFTLENGRDGTIDFQIVKIAANIIDQYDSDSYPTVIKFPNNGGEKKIAGVECIPHIYALQSNIFIEQVLHGVVPEGFELDDDRKRNWSGHGALLSNLVLQPKLWNPSVTSSRPTGKFPRRFRITAKLHPQAYAPFCLLSHQYQDEAYNQNEAWIFKKDSQLHPWHNQHESTVDDGASNGFYHKRWNFNAIAKRHGLPEIHNYAPGQPNNPATKLIEGLSFEFEVKPRLKWPYLFSDPRTLMANGYPSTSLEIDASSNTTFQCVQDIMRPGFNQSGEISPYIELLNSRTHEIVGFPLGKFWMGPAVLKKEISEISTPLEQLVDLSKPAKAKRLIMFRNLTTIGHIVLVGLEYLDLAGNWVQYDEKYYFGDQRDNKITNDGESRLTLRKVGVASAIRMNRVNFYSDPRTNRWGPVLASANSVLFAPNNFKWKETLNCWKEGRSHHYSDRYAIDIATLYERNSHYTSELHHENNQLFESIPGQHRSVPSFLYSESRNPAGVAFNNEDSPYAYRDPDNIQRSPMGRYWTIGSYHGQPMAASNPDYANSFQPFDEVTCFELSPLSDIVRQNRPIILNRAFNNVGELGYVFSGTPWRNLDFFTVESGDKYLLEYFCVRSTIRSERSFTAQTFTAQTPLVGGKIDLNTAGHHVLMSIIKNTAREYSNPQNLALIKNELDVEKLAKTIIDYRDAPNFRPFQSLADLVGYYDETYQGFSEKLGATLLEFDDYATHDFRNKNRREALVRALTSIGEVNTWNLFIDLVAEVGSIEQNSSRLRAFTPRAQSHIRVHVSIDPFTCEIVHQNAESVY